MLMRLLFGCLFSAATVLAGDVLTLREGEKGHCEDVTLDYQLRPDDRLKHNFGAAPTLVVYCSGGKNLSLENGEVLRNDDGWRKLALLRFDLSWVPREKIRSIRLVLHVLGRAKRIPHEFELRRLLRDDLQFGSGVDAVEEGSVSAACRRTPTEGWGRGDEVMPRAGKDFDTQAFAHATLEEGATTLVFDLPPDDLEWAKGFVIYPTTRSQEGGGYVIFASSEHPQANLRPALEIHYQ